LTGHRAPDGDRRTARARTDFARRIVVCDGAMGTMLHTAGVPLDRSLSELNLSRPALVADLHKAYVAAGARLLQTNTFDANRLRLGQRGLEENVAEINIAGARLARQAAETASEHPDGPVLVAGSVGPALSAPALTRVPAETRAATLREQIDALADWVDVLVLETFGDLESLVQAVEVALSTCDLPVIAQLTFGDDGCTLRGEDPATAASVLGGYDVAAIGANCTVGPAALHDVIAEFAAATSLPVSVQPNAGVPRRLGGQVRYARNASYFGEAAPGFVASGATLIGGCCGTTPAHVRAIASALDGMGPAVRIPPSRSRGLRLVPPAPAEHPARDLAGWPPPGRFVVVPGLPTPRDQHVDTFVELAAALRDAGADRIAVTEPEPPRTSVSPVAAGVVARERVGIEVMFSIEAVDRGLPALQADLLGAHALGLRTVICRTGSARVAGDYPDAGMQTTVDSLGLISLLAGLNVGVDCHGVAIRDATRFVVGAGIRTAALDVGTEVDRALAKVRAGAHFLVTDVVYDAHRAGRMLSLLRDRGVVVPVLVSIAPHADQRLLRAQSRETPGVVSAPSVVAGAQTPAAATKRALEMVAVLGGLAAGVVVRLSYERAAEAVGLVRSLVAARDTA